MGKYLFLIKSLFCRKYLLSICVEMILSILISTLCNFYRYTKTEVTPHNPEISLHPDHIGGLRLAVASFSGVETKFGLMFPKFNPAPRTPSPPVKREIIARLAGPAVQTENVNTELVQPVAVLPANTSES